VDLTEKVEEEWRKIHNEKLHNLYCSLNQGRWNGHDMYHARDRL